jgi:hypothetical protein
VPLDPVDPVVDRRMRPLIAHGRALLRAHNETLDPVERDIGGASMDIVSEDDFHPNSVLCFRWIETSRKPLHILCANGRKLCFQVTPLTGRRL